MKKIKILSESLANKIAAGEVVERPSSVVKELLENSIDAESTNIKIIIEEFGIKEIRIIDNGKGISNEDIETAFMRHATSKISTDYDLFHIKTLGFRGEALASIASVSNVEIKSCAGEEQGKYLKIVAGKIEKNEFYAPIKGTDISVKNLFYNTPARLKYLKNPHTEQANIINVINKLALAHTNISFEVIVDGKIVLKTYGDCDTHKVISKIYNMAVAKSLLSFSGSNDDYKITGYVSSPEETRANKNYINIFINGRYIKNYSIQNAIISSYGTFLMKNRYPVAIIYITMDPILLDVNVHPTKQEVRLSKEKELVELINTTIKKRLSTNTYIPDGINNVLRKKEKEKIEQMTYNDYIDNSFEIRETSFLEKNNENYSYSFDGYKKSTKENENFLNFIKKEENFSYNYEEGDNFNEDCDIYEEIVIKKNLPNLTVLAQIFKTYILAQTGDELYLIDQHAAQERYNYEKIQASITNKNFYSKQLLIPLFFNFSSSDMLTLKNILAELNAIGIIIEEFGDNKYIIREYPSWIEKNEEIIITDIIEKLMQNKKIKFVDLLDDMIAMASCKASIKANQVLTHDEMIKVVDDLYTCENPFTCPHGRPIISKMTKKDLEKMFKRIV